MSPVEMLFANERSSSTFEEIPVIDFSNANSTDPIVRRALADQMRDACVNVGFFYIKNHGIPEPVIEKTVDSAKEFFKLPLETKMELDIHKTPNFKGYTALLGENTNPENRGDMHEGFDIGWSDEEAPGYTGAARTEGAMSGGNVWPDEKLLPEFKGKVLQYYHAAIDLGQTLFRLFALALDLPENFFDDKTTKPAAIMRLLYYPPQTGVVDDRVIGIGAHTDYECFTILWQDPSVQALQVLNADGKWIDAVPIPGTVVLNIGDQLARWTNDVFKSTMHRAVNRSGVERYSIPLFFGTDYEVKLEALPSCVSDDNPPKYEVVTAGEYVQSRLEATYAHSKKP
ncbi:Clavaminate synthase-like protein [Punctularia strigosozonata HHB-11173 SS5]|uniref:Clavaminate synthase-like protein n=1 Tax=Punctularia strigosozonata (strain HHB-11173) TaxID=741275 RepID=UPI0004417A09|nr:Clavaminate synthase-like protein [Punctularia strigosozonata HHB-11173 SS5]EIN12486.1 Clavaminate synthase-like protein [Punctularia strigosozonata HHB-11173 SS5]